MSPCCRRFPPPVGPAGHPSSRLRVAAIALALQAVGGAAHASQYPLDQVAAIIAPDEARKLRHAGVRTTADLLTWGRTPEGRRLLAERARLPVEQVLGWVLMADLMRVPGIGPDVARLLHAVGVRALVDLRRCDPEVTAASIRETNRKSRLSTNPPGAESLRYWVQLASSLPILVMPD